MGEGRREEDALADADVPDFAFVDECLECLPGWVDVLGEVVVQFAGAFLQRDGPAYNPLYH